MATSVTNPLTTDTVLVEKKPNINEAIPSKDIKPVVEEETKTGPVQNTELIEGDHLKIAVIGNVDSGKSTLVGVLTKGIFDDGRGSARARVFNYRHEAENGRTSSIAQEIMGFDEKGKQVHPDRFVQSKNKYWVDVVKKSTKIATLVDLCGHEKYLKTTIFGLTGLVPDYSMIIIGANMGISRMTKEHLGITLTLKIPFFVVLTKVDMCPDNKLKETMSTLAAILKHKHVNKSPILIKDDEDLKTSAENLSNNRILSHLPRLQCDR